MKKLIWILIILILTGCSSSVSAKGGKTVPPTMTTKTKTIISHGAKTDFQLQIIRLHKATGADTLGGSNSTIQDIYCGTNVDDDFFAVRFYDNDGITPLKHRRFNVISGVSADFIVKVPSIPATGTTKITIAYAPGGYTTESTDETVTNWNIDGWVRQYANDASGQEAGEPSVIYENGKFRMWYSAVRLDEVGKPLLFPGFNAHITSLVIGYRESTDGKVWSAMQPCVDVDGVAHGRSFVYKHTDGYYHMLTLNFSTNQYEYYQSTTGNSGTWTKISSNVLSGNVPGTWESVGQGNTTFFNENGTWYVYYESQNGDAAWKVGLATGTSLTSLTKYPSNPVISQGVYATAAGEFHKVNNLYYTINHDANMPGALPTQLAIYKSSNNQYGTWTRMFWMLKLYYQKGKDAQLGDPSVVEANGKTYLYYCANLDQTSTPPSTITLAIWDAPLSRILDPVITTAKGDDLEAEGWTFESGYGEVRPADGSLPTTYFRKISKYPNISPVSIDVLTDSTHQLRTRKAINSTYNENTFYCIARAEQINKKFVPLRLDKDASNTILCGVWFDTDGNIKYYNGTTPTTAKAYTAQTYYKFTVKAHSSGYDLLIDDVVVASNIPYYSAFAKPTYFKVEQDLGAEGYVNALYTVQYSDIATEPTWGVTSSGMQTNISLPHYFNVLFNSVTLTNSNIAQKIYSDASCTVEDATLGQFTTGQVYIVDRWLWNETDIPIAVQLYDSNETLGIVTYSWDGVTYADPTIWHLINPGEKHNFKAKVNLVTTSIAESFFIGKRVRG